MRCRHYLPLLIGLCAALPALGQTYKWTDEKGNVHYSDSPPPEVSKRGAVEINKQGRTVKQIEGELSPEQRAAREEEIRRKKEEEQRFADQRRKDLSLLATYTSEKEIELARERNSQTVDARIKGTQERLEDLAAQRTELENEMEFYKAGKSKTKKQREAPIALSTGLENNKREQARLEELLKKLETEKQEVEGRYAADKARYRELKSGVPPGTKPTASAPAPTQTSQAGAETKRQ